MLAKHDILRVDDHHEEAVVNVVGVIVVETSVMWRRSLVILNCSMYLVKLSA